MTKRVEKQYWFKPKKYGWGWGLPATWQGWLSFGLFLAIWLLALVWLVFPDTTQDIPITNIVLFLGIMVVDIVALLYVSFKHGEPPKWRWRGKTRVERKAAKSKSD